MEIDSIAEQGPPLQGKEHLTGGAADNVVQLTVEERSRIRAEEFYREEVRAALRTPAVASRSSWWEVLNSSFALWALSSVVLALFGWGYQVWLDSRKTASEQDKQRTQIVAEIRNRAKQADAYLAKCSDSEQLSYVLPRLDGINIDYPVYDQLETTKMGTLLKRLEDLVEHKKPAIQEWLDNWPSTTKDAEAIKKTIDALNLIVDSI
jgi:hypothetical protein